jgi:tetratricopeptide (TPR) repeat protein
VFINYRGEDSHSYGALLHRDLSGHFGEDLVFLDCESIPAGADFVEEMLGRVRSARVVLAVIGHRWLTTADPTGRRRIDDPQDWIHRELAEAFAAGVRVIPVLTDQAELPAAADLPADIAALSRCQYRHLRRREPTSDLARIVADLTSLDPILAAAVTSRDNAPRQLPAAPVGFIGRGDQLAALDRALTRRDGSSSEGGGPGGGATVVISAIGGTGGIGKTWLALTWAHRNLHRFPDGQLAVDLRGFSPGDPRAAADVLADFLAALGVDRDHQPTDPDARAALYRTHTASRRLLILLDNAATPDQVVPLLPGGTSCTVLVTSRHRLPALLTRHGARPVHVDVLTDTEARTLLTAALDHTHTAAAVTAPVDWAMRDLIALCGGFPLALGLIAARIRTHPDLLDEIVTDLRELGLDTLDSDDPDASLPTVLSWSVRWLTKQHRTVFGLLGIAPGPDLDLPAATSLTGLSERDTRTVLRGLVDASLITHAPGGRYAMHDLVRDYAATTAREDLAEPVRRAALERVVDFYRHTAHAADHFLEPHRQPIHCDPPAPGTRPYSLEDVPAAVAWLDTHHPHLLAAQRLAATHLRHQAVWHLAWTLVNFHARRGHHHNQLAVWQAALQAATQLSDPTYLIYAHRYLGHAYAGLGAHEQAIEHLHQALALAEDHHDPARQAHIHHAFAWAWERRGNDWQALEHAHHSLDLVRPLDHPVWEAEILNTVGWHAARLGDYDTARAHCQAALALQRQHDDSAEAATLHSLGYIAHHTGQHTHAVDYYRQALALNREHGDTYHQADILENLGQTYAALSDHEQARAGWRQALELYQAQQRTVDIARVQQQLDELDNPDDATGSHK